MNKVEKIIKNKYNNEFKFISMNKEGTKCTIQHLCDKCNNYIIEDISIKGNLSKGIYTCPECRRIDNEMQFKEKLNECGFIMTNDLPYINCDTYVYIQHLCNKCNDYKWKIKPRNFNGNCKECSRLDRINSKFNEELLNNTNNEWKLLGNYINNKTYVTIQHRCGYKKNVIPRNIDYNTMRCNRCSDIIENTKDLIYYMNKYTPNIELKGEFIDKKTPIAIHCNVCGCDSVILLCNLKMRHRCPKCLTSLHESLQEKEVRAYIETLVECHSKEYSTGILDGKDIDILTKSNVGFEYNGDYWHQEGVNLPIGYHKDKTMKAKEKGIILYHIWERDWLKRKDEVKEFIRKALSKG